MVQYVQLPAPLWKNASEDSRIRGLSEESSEEREDTISSDRPGVFLGSVRGETCRVRGRFFPRIRGTRLLGQGSNSSLGSSPRIAEAPRINATQASERFFPPPGILGQPRTILPTRCRCSVCPLFSVLLQNVGCSTRSAHWSRHSERLRSRRAQRFLQPPSCRGAHAFARCCRAQKRVAC